MTAFDNTIALAMMDFARLHTGFRYELIETEDHMIILSVYTHNREDNIPIEQYWCQDIFELLETLLTEIKEDRFY